MLKKRIRIRDKVVGDNHKVIVNGWVDRHHTLRENMTQLLY